MATNRYFSHNRGLKSEQNLYEDIIIESLKIYGQDVYYLPRTLVNQNILGDAISAQFSDAYKVEMYIENVQGFDGEGDLFTKFGVEIRDQATFIVARRRWNQTLNDYGNEISSDRPREGDLIYLPLSKSMFQIAHVEHEQPFYQLNNLTVFKLKCELFEFSDEDFDTDVPEIDAIERDLSFNYLLTLAGDSDLLFKVGETVQQTTLGGVVLSGEIAHWNDSDRILSLVHFGGDDGEYHEPVTGISITTTRENVDIEYPDYSAIVESWTIDDKQSNTEINDTIKDAAEWDFLDFSESNPFGDPN
jgi:hypothetical protein